MIKKVLKRLFNIIGYTVTKNPRQAANVLSSIKIGNYYLKINNNNGIKYCYENYKDYGSQLTRLTALVHKYHSDMTVVDIGANLGDSVSLIKSGAGVPIVSIEGDNAITGLFKTNTSQFKDVKLINTFLSDHAGELKCTFSKEGHNLTLNTSATEKNQQVIDVLDIDTLYKNGSIDKSSKLLKIDTEGFDLKIIKGGNTFLSDVKPVILFEFNRDNLADTEVDAFTIFPWLLDKGYNLILFYESDGRFMFSSVLDNLSFLRQMYEYIDGRNAKIYYTDLIVFHSQDNEMARDFIGIEEKHRLNHS